MEKMNDLKIIRYKHGGITAKEAAKKIGMTYQNYLAIECGRRKGSIKFWLEFQKLFGLSDSEMWSIISNRAKKLGDIDE